MVLTCALVALAHAAFLVREQQHIHAKVQARLGKLQLQYPVTQRMWSTTYGAGNVQNGYTLERQGADSVIGSHNTEDMLPGRNWTSLQEHTLI